MLWTFLAGQPMETAEIDRYIRDMAPGPISMGEKKLTRSDMRADDEQRTGRSLQEISDRFGLMRTHNRFAGRSGPGGSYTASRCPDRDSSEMRTVGSDTVNQRAARQRFAGDEGDLWEYIHERGNKWPVD